MAAAEEYRHIAEEFFRLAREAKTEEERTRFFCNGALLVTGCGARERDQMGWHLRPQAMTKTRSQAISRSFLTKAEL